MSNFFLDIRDKKHTGFDTFIFITILLSAVLIGFETDSWFAKQFHDLFHIADILILSIFIIEIVIKISAEGSKPWKYFLDPWNLFDFIIVVLSFLPYFLTHGQEDTHAFAAFRIIRLVRAVRVFRVVRVITHVKHLQILVETLIKSLPALFYVIMLLSILFYIYGVVGVFLFGQYDALHFGSLPISILTMFQCIAGGWVGIVDNLNVIKDIPHPSIIPIYFISFYFLAGLIILNLFIGVIVSELGAIKRDKEIEEIRKSFSDDLDSDSYILLLELEKNLNEANSTFKTLQLALDKQRGKK